jgi:uncharacterized membrane protein YgaE (UPF0421/DUF939 family)
VAPAVRHLSPSAARRRLRGSLRGVAQTAVAAVAAWYAAVALLPDPRPAFASIAAVVALGASHGRRPQRAIQLTGGVVLGLTVADLIVQVIGTGALQMGVMVLLAMTSALVLGGGELLVSEAAVSAILLVSLDPSTGGGFTPNRMLEAAIGGAIALVVSSVVLPHDPVLEVGRVMQSLFDRLGRTLERLSAALDAHSVGTAEEALVTARSIDELVRELDDTIATGRETVRLAPPRRGSAADLERYARSVTQLDYAVRDARVLARHAVRALRAGEAISPELSPAVRQLELSVWELAAAYDAPDRVDYARDHALTAAALAGDSVGAGPATTQIFGQVRSVAADLRRAADATAGAGDSVAELPTEELLLPAG